MAILVAAMPTPTMGSVTPTVKDLPALAILSPKACTWPPMAWTLPPSDMLEACNFCKSLMARFMFLSV